MCLGLNIKFPSPPSNNQSSNNPSPKNHSPNNQSPNTQSPNTQSPKNHSPTNQSPNNQPTNALPSSKSVAFDLDDAGKAEDPGYDTDGSTSTIGPNDGHNRHRRHRRSSSAARSQNTSSRRRRHKESDESDSTVELPSRFDSKGQPLHRDPAMEKFESLVNRFTKALF